MSLKIKPRSMLYLTVVCDYIAIIRNKAWCTGEEFRTCFNFDWLPNIMTIIQEILFFYLIFQPIVLKTILSYCSCTSLRQCNFYVIFYLLILPAMTWSIMATPTSCDRPRPWEITSSLEYTQIVRLRTIMTYCPPTPLFKA